MILTCVFVVICLMFVWAFAIECLAMNRRHRKEWAEMRRRHFIERTIMELHHREIRRLIHGADFHEEDEPK